jgi:hypothetical protein
MAICLGVDKHTVFHTGTSKKVKLQFTRDRVEVFTNTKGSGTSDSSKYHYTTTDDHLVNGATGHLEIY